MEPVRPGLPELDPPRHDEVPAPEVGHRHLGPLGPPRGQFRHPVFGNKEVWVDQDMHPFLTPAAERTAPRFTAKLVETLDEVTHTITFGE